MSSELKQKAVSGIVWTALQRYSTILIQFISGIILARLLTPYDYGCIGMLTIFMVLAQTFIDGGFGSALIQKKRPTEADYSSIFWWNMGMAVVMYAILFLCAPSIARFYKIPLLSDVLRVQGLILFIYAFNIIQQNQLRKKLNFKLISIVTIITSIMALSVTIWMAYSGFGVWSLVAQYMITAAIPAVVFWFTVKWRPQFVFSAKSFKELFGFGFYMFLTNLVNEFGKQIQGLLIGRIYNPATLGYYSKARSTERLASNSISQTISQVTYPLYAEAQDDKKMLSNMIKQTTSSLAYITFPMMFILILCAKPLFVLLYSDRWLPCVPYFQILCLSGLAECLHSVNTQSIAAIGKSRIMLRWTIVKRFAGLCFVVAGLVFWGMRGLLCGVVLNYWFSYFVNICLVSKYIGYKWWLQLKHLAPIVLVTIVAFIASYGLSSFFSLSMYYDGLLRATLYLSIYIGWSVIFKPNVFVYCKDLISSSVNKAFKKTVHSGN